MECVPRGQSGEIEEIPRPDLDDDSDGENNKKVSYEDALARLYDAAAKEVKDMIQSFIQHDVESIVLGWFMFKMADSNKAATIHTPTTRIKQIIKNVLSCDISFDIESMAITLFQGAPMFMHIQINSLSRHTKNYLMGILGSARAFYKNIETDTPGTTRYYGFRFLAEVGNSNIRNNILLCLMRLMNREDVRRNMDWTPNQLILISIGEEIMRCYDEFVQNRNGRAWSKANESHLKNLQSMYAEITKIANDEMGITGLTGRVVTKFIPKDKKNLLPPVGPSVTSNANYKI